MSNLETVQFKDKEYLAIQASGNAARFIMPFAKEFCKGKGYDIGCNRIEWALEGAIPIDLTFNNGFHALNLPEANVDFCFSSHCLEHLPNWVEALDYWIDTLKVGGILFLYLPSYEQEYWRPYSNRKHIHILFPEFIADYLSNRSDIGKFFVSGDDLNASFSVVAEKV